jgi:lipopolysaccharide export LptBFGC system permease protein LptF
VEFSEYVIPKGFDMRLDLIFQDIYDLEPNEVGLYLENLDVIYYINNIDNPLNIKEGLVLKYPTNLGDILNFRVSNIDSDINNKDIVKDKLSYPNKSTRKDKSRENFVKNGYSLPPVVLETPRPPVSIKDGKFNIGGI